MTALARSTTPERRLVNDIRRDWRRWNATERCGAVTILTLVSIAFPVALLILSPAL